MVLLTLLAGCEGDTTHPCDDGSITCESQMVLLIGDPRTDFEMHVTDEVGLDVALSCPYAGTGPYLVNGVTVTCGGGQVTLNQFGRFGDEITVQLEQGLEEVYHPDWQLGGDFCGNPCSIGSIEL